jgi:protein involved in polysaccharide export with SLBB domain
MHLSDAIRLAGGLLPSAGDQIAIAHARQDGFETPEEATYSPQTGTVAPDLPLKDGDVVTIQGRGSWVDHPYVVTVKGAVNKPGPVILPARHVRLSEVVALAGGLKAEAFPEGAEFDRLPDNLTTDQQKHLSTLIERVNELLNTSEYKRALAQSDVQRIQAIGRAAGAQAIGIPGLTPPTTDGSASAAAAASPLNNRDLVTPPRDLTPADLAPAGNVAVNLKTAMRHPGGDDDILMTDGDTVIVPERPTTVQVVGAVINARGVVFHPGEKAGDYIDQAGGFAPDAAKDRVLVIRVGGGLVPIKKAREILPGDTILVPTGVLAAKISNHQNEWDSIFKSLTNSALVFFIAKKLIGF